MTQTPVISPLKVSLVLPSYNESGNIRETVARCQKAFSGLCADHEILIVDDGSTDGSGAVAEELARKDARIRVLHNPINLGVGISVLSGFKAAKGDLVLHNAMDYPFDLEDLRQILPLFPQWDIVVCVRTNRSAHSLYRKLTSLVNFWLIRLLFRTTYGDMNFVQVYKKEVIAAVNVKSKSPAFVTPELLMKARAQGFKATEVKVPFHPRRRGSANYGKHRDILWTLADMLSCWLESWRKPA